MDACFVPQSGKDGADTDTRKTIRRHVMLGKNSGKIRKPKLPVRKGFAVFHKDDCFWGSRPEQKPVPCGLGSDSSFISFVDTLNPVIMNDTLQFCATSDEEIFTLDPHIDFDFSSNASAYIQLLAHDALHLNVMVSGAQTYMDHVFWQSTSPSGSEDGAASDFRVQERTELRSHLQSHHGQQLRPFGDSRKLDEVESMYKLDQSSHLYTNFGSAI